MGNQLRVHLNMPHIGSMLVELMHGEQRFGFVASYILYGDAPEELTKCITSILSGSAFTAMRWFLEPGEYHFEFETQGGKTKLSVNESLRMGQVATHFQVEMDSFELCLAFWRSLRCLQAQILDDEYENGWHTPFPQNALHRLTTVIKQVKEERDK